MEDNPDIRLEIHAHTDNIGPESYNMNLSQRRAQSVVDYLVESGIAEDRLVAVGFGESRPRIECPDPNDCTKEQHQQNRRTEMMVIDDQPETEVEPSSDSE